MYSAWHFPFGMTLRRNIWCGLQGKRPSNCKNHRIEENLGAMCSAFIGPAVFSASFLRVLISTPLGAGLATTQLFVANKSDVLSQIFNIVVTGFTSFVAAGLASTSYFCYSAVIASSIILILPGWLVC
ncbi:hypothetical protein PTTG_27070 [Puccinia triticina 1-1 BBBD Race 1]|uniref:Threonine/serine exporter-like N-terminal domain-containing protein n=1 Tax=Puccinia triticina (isolate 1-1 / race 1 (BBBD)) TaxID=630390 RepID=A0A180GNB6_PUCT1|nr:hypothetical protein PTTG_27070 [Puccinia triticina 1-1 BBBD Race 1]